LVLDFSFVLLMADQDRKRKRGKEDKGKGPKVTRRKVEKNEPPVLSDGTTLAKHGLETLVIAIDEEYVVREVEKVIAFHEDWFLPYLEIGLGKIAKEKGEKVLSLEELREEYGFASQTLTLKEKGEIMGLYRNPGRRNKAYPEGVSKAISKAFEANTSAQFRCFETFTKSGMGINTKITATKFHLTLFKRAIKALKEAGYDVVPTGIPHAIVKVPSGDGYLKFHVDFRGGSFAGLYAALRKTKSMDEWLKTQGRQTLLHVRCGTGSTLGYENMTLETFRLLMAMMDPEKPFPGFKTAQPPIMTPEMWSKNHDGPNFFDFSDERIIDTLNDVLISFFSISSGSKTQPLNKEDYEWCYELDADVGTPLLVPNASPRPVFKVRLSPESDAPHLVSWPAGFPHAANKEKTAIRYTITLPFDYPEKAAKEVDELNRAKQFSRDLLDPTKWNQKHKQFRGGLTHEHPELAFKYMQIPSFAALYPSTPQQMDHFLNQI